MVESAISRPSGLMAGKRGLVMGVANDHSIAWGIALVTLTFEGASRVMPNYNVMGVAKAALEASVRYLAADLGKDNIRVNAISAGPMRTLAGSAVGDARMVFKWNKAHSPLKKNIELEHIGGAALYFLSELLAGVPRGGYFLDAGHLRIGIAPPPDLKSSVAPEKRTHAK